MPSAWNQLRYVARKLARSPLFTLVAVVTLALGIGANAAVFSVVHGVLLKPLPFEDADRLVGLWHTAPGLGFELVNQSPATYFTYRDQGETFEDVGMWDNDQVPVTGLDEPEQVEALRVTDGTLRILRVQPLIGRLFDAEDDLPDHPETVVLSHEYWQSRLGGDPDVLGRTLTISGRAHEIIGVTRPGLRFLDEDPQLFLTFQFDRAKVFMGNFSYQALARLAPGATVEQAGAEVDRLIPVAVADFPGGLTLEMLREARFAARVRPLKEDAVGDVANTLWVLLGTVGLVLLIACANVANLFLVRAEDRQLEVALRSALGASRGHLARTFLLESLVLGLLGGLAGLALAWGGLRLLVHLGPDGLPRLAEIGIDTTVLLFTLTVSIAAGGLFGLAPLLRHRGADLIAALKDGARGDTGRARHRTRAALVVSQVALALILLVGSGLMIRSFQALLQVDPGFDDPEGVLTLRVAIPSAEVEDPVEVAQVYERIEQELARLPGVRTVGASSSIAMDGWDSNDAVDVEGFPIPDGQLPPIRRFKWISPDYFQAMGIPMMAGRPFDWADLHDQAHVVVVTENFAREYWESPSEALGKRVRLPRLSEDRVSPWREIVGVVGNVHDDGVDQEAPEIVYWPRLVKDFWDDPLWAHRSQAFTLRIDQVPATSLVRGAREAVASVHPNLPIANVRTLAEIQRRSTARTSFTLVMLAIAAGVALALGAVGIYGVTSYSVSQRTREIGVRMALGAQRQEMRQMVLRQGLVLVATGVVVGWLAALGLTRLMSALLFGVSPLDPLTYGGVAVALAAVALLASYIPARRASRVDPMEALRWE